MKRTYTVYSLVIGLSLNLVFIMMFYTMLHYGSARVYVNANYFNEFWIEFFLLQASFIFMGIIFIGEFRKWIKTGCK